MLAEILVRGCFGTEYADASAMLPNFANVATNEEASNIFRKFNPGKKVCVWSIYGRPTRIFFSLANAPNSLVLLFANVIAAVSHFGHDVRARSLFLVVLLTALAPAA